MPMTEHSILGLGPHGFHRPVYFPCVDARNAGASVRAHGLTLLGLALGLLPRAVEVG